MPKITWAILLFIFFLEPCAMEQRKCPMCYLYNLTLKTFLPSFPSLSMRSLPLLLAPFFVVSTLWVSYCYIFKCFQFFFSSLTGKYQGQPKAAIPFLVPKLGNTNKIDLFSTCFYIFKSYEKWAVQTKMTLSCLIILLFICSLWPKQMFHWLQLSKICR